MNNIIELNKQEINFVNGGCEHLHADCPDCQFGIVGKNFAIAASIIDRALRAVAPVAEAIIGPGILATVATMGAVGVAGIVATITLLSPIKE